jgi:hypothetical protein
MSFVASVNRLVLVFMDTFRQFLRGRIWLLLLGYYAFQWLVLYAHYQFNCPVFHWLVSASLMSQADPLARAAFSHYPAHFVLLPEVYGWAKFAVGVICEGLVFGAVAAVFQRQFLDRPVDAPRTSILKQWPNLAIIWIILNGLMLLVSYLLPKLLQSYLYSPKRVAAFSFIAMPAIFTFITALFFYALPLTVATGRNAFQAIGHGLKLFVRFPITTLVLSGIIVCIPVILAAITSGYATTIVEKFRPELVYWLLVVGLVAEMIASFFWMGTASRFIADEID